MQNTPIAIRWQPAFKQLIYRNDAGKLIVTISQNSYRQCDHRIARSRCETASRMQRHMPDANLR